MKKLFLFAALAVAFRLVAVDTALLKYLPAKSPIMGEIEVSKLLRHPEIKAALEAPDSVGAFQTLGIAPKDVRDIAGYYLDGDFGVIVRVADGKALKAKLDASPMIKTGDTAVQIAAMDFNGVRVYRCNVQGKNEAVFASFAAADVLAFAHSQEELEAYLKAPKFDGSRKFPAAAAAAMWGIYVNHEVRADSQDGQLLNVEATLAVVGKERADIVVAAVLNCDRPEYAAQLGMMISGIIQMGCCTVFADNPELGQKFLEMFKSKPTGKALRISLRITPEIAEFLSGYLSGYVSQTVAGTAAGDEGAKQPQGGVPAAK